MPTSPLDETVLQQIIEYINSHSEFSHLLSPLNAVHIIRNDSILQINFKYRYYNEFFEKKCRKDFERLCNLCFDTNIKFIYDGLNYDNPLLKLTISQSVDPFEDFICNRRNYAAAECAKSVYKKEDPGLTLVVFHGPSGCGKSLILSLLASALIRKYGYHKIYFGRAEAFTLNVSPEHFWQTQNALLLDDGQTLTTCPGRQRHLSNIIDCAKNSSLPAKIIISLPGQDVSAFKARLSRRLEEALFIALPPPDFSLRLAYAEKKAGELGLDLSREQFLGLARHTHNLSIISGILQKIKFYASLASQAPEMEELKKWVLHDTKVPAWLQIVHHIAKHLGIEASELTGKSRRQEIVQARQVAMFVCRYTLGLSYPEIGRIFGGRDHATVMHSIKKIQQLRQSDPVMHNLLTKFEQEDF